MAVVTPKSSVVTNLDSTPPVKNPAYLSDGVLREQIGSFLVANGDSIASVYRLARVHSSERISQLMLYSDAITGGVADVGLYDTATNGGAVVDVDFFASGQAISTALPGTDVQYEAGTGPSVIANISKRLWEQLGYTSDPNRYYDVGVTLTAAATAGGTIAVKVRSVRPSA